MQITNSGDITSLRGTITANYGNSMVEDQEKLIEGDFDSMVGIAEESDDKGFTLYIPLPLVKVEDLTIKKIRGSDKFDRFLISLPEDVSDNNPFISNTRYNPSNYTVETGTGFTRKIEISKDAFDINKVRFSFKNSVLLVRVPFWEYMIAEDVAIATD